MPIAAPLIAGAASVLGQGINAYSTGKMNKRAERFAIKSYLTQRKDTLSDWNMQNEYNSPSAAMERLRKAGLNPNLVYGDGNAIQSASPIKSPDAPNPLTIDRSQNVDLSGVGQAALSIYDIQQKRSTNKQSPGTKHSVSTGLYIKSSSSYRYEYRKQKSRSRL